MAAKIVLNTVSLAKEKELVVSGNFEKCRYYKGPIDKVAGINEEYSSKKLEREINEKFLNLDAADRELGVCLLNSRFSKNETTKLILHGKLLDSVVASFPNLSMTVAGTLHLKWGESGSSWFLIPFSAESSPVSEAMELEVFCQHYFYNWNTTLKWNDSPLYLSDLKLWTILGNYASCKFTWSITDFEVTIHLSKTDLEHSIGLPLAQEYLNKMLMDSEHTDLTIVGKDGTEVNCQKSFLAVHSDVFKAMLAKGSETKESKTNRIEMVDMSGAGVMAFLQFLYSLDMTSPKNDGMIALELLQAGHKYNIKPLEGAMTQIFLCWPKEWQGSDSVKVAIRLFCFARKVEELEQLKSVSVGILKSFYKELHKSDAYNDLFVTDIDAVKELFVLFCSS